MNRSTSKYGNSSHLIDTIDVMKRQERSGYLTKNGLYDHPQRQQQGSTTTTKKNIKIDGECRKLMVIWFKQLAKFINMNHHTVAMAVNTLDRFIEKTPEMLSSDNASYEFQLIAITSLYTIVKVHELEALDPITMSKLCKNLISVEEIERMELNILTTLRWRINVPTSMEYAELYLKILFPELVAAAEKSERECSHHCNEEEKKEDDQTTTTKNTTYSIYKKLIQCQLEYAMEDTRFLGLMASDIAFTATYNTITAITASSSCLRERLNELQNTINVQTLSNTLKDDLMDHMQRTESDTILSIIIRSQQAASDKAMTTKHHQQQREQQQFGWLSGKSVCSYLSPRSIVMSRE